MSTLRTDTLQTIDQTFSIPVSDLGSATAFTTFKNDLLNASNAAKGASLVGYTAAGTGAVAQTVKTMLDHGQLHVDDFGALGDGSDDTVKIQAAVDAALAQGKWLVGTGGKTYTVTSINFKTGARAHSIKFKTKAGATDFVSPVTIDGRTVAKDDIILSYIEIDGNRINQTAIDSASEDGGRHGFRILGHVTRTYILNPKASYCGTDGIAFFSNVVSFPAFKDVYVLNGYFTNNRRHGGAIDSTSVVKFINCVMNSNGLDLNGTDPLNSGGRGSRQLGSLYGNGFDAESYGLGTQCQDLSFEHCTMKGNARSGLLILPNGLDFANPAWRPYANINVIGGSYDEGTQTYDGKASIVVTALNMTSEKRGLDTLNIDNVALASGLLVTNVRNGSIRCRIDSKTSTGVHAGIINSDDIDIDISTTQPPVYEIVSSTVAYTRKFTGTDAPTLASTSGCTLGSLVSTRIASSKYSGQVYRVTGTITLTGADAAASGILSVVTGGREIVTVSITAINSNNNTTLVLPYSSLAGAIVFKPGFLSPHTFDAIITVF